MIRNAFPLAALVAATLGLSACAAPGFGPEAAVTVTRTAPTTRDALAISVWQYMAARGPVLVEVRGTPAGLLPAAATTPESVAEAVAFRLRAPRGRVPATFTTDPAAAGTDRQRIVLLFGVPLAVDGRVACRVGSVEPGRADMAGERLVLEAALCSGDESITHVRVNGPPATSGAPDDPALRAALNAAMRHLVPWRDREKDDHDTCILPPC